MPLRDHFRPPLDNDLSREELHSQWPAVIVQSLRKRLPSGFIAGPRVHAVDIETTLVDFAEHEVRIYDARRDRRLVAAIEIVSIANKDRPERRNMFLAKCSALLREGIAVSIVDLVTARQFNLYAELLAFIGHADPTMGDDSPVVYAATCRWIEKGKRAILQAWSKPLAVGQPLPTLPLWLSADLAVPLDLEESYEQACSDLSIA
jgi:Protein of unknown function (DUF4058)